MGSDMVRLPSDSFIADFRDAVKEKNAHRISVDAGELTVYRNKTAYERKEVHLEEDSSVLGLGESKKNAMVVVLPKPKFYTHLTLLGILKLNFLLTFNPRQNYLLSGVPLNLVQHQLKKI